MSADSVFRVRPPSLLPLNVYGLKTAPYRDCSCGDELTQPLPRTMYHKLGLPVYLCVVTQSCSAVYNNSLSVKLDITNTLSFQSAS